MCEHTESLNIEGHVSCPSIPIYCRCDCIIPVITEQQGRKRYGTRLTGHTKNLSHIVTQSAYVITESTCDKVFK